MPTLSGVAGGCAVADTCGVETALATWPVLAVASITGESEAAAREELASIAKLKKITQSVVSDSIWRGGNFKGFDANNRKKKNENTLTQ